MEDISREAKTILQFHHDDPEPCGDEVLYVTADCSEDTIEDLLEPVDIDPTALMAMGRGTAHLL